MTSCLSKVDESRRSWAALGSRRFTQGISAFWDFFLRLKMHHKVAHSEHSILRKFKDHFVLGRSLELLTGFEPVYHLKDCVRSTYTCNYAGGNWIRGQRRPKYYVCTLLSVRKRVGVAAQVDKGAMEDGLPSLKAKNRHPPSLLEWTWHPFPMGLQTTFPTDQY